MSLDRIDPVRRLDPPVKRAPRDREQDKRRKQEQPEPRREEREDDGLPHVDVRA